MKSMPLLLAAGSALALAGCATLTEEVTETVGANFHANLLGSSEVPPADPDGTGTAHVSINDATNQICVDLEVRNISGVTAAHIHQGAAGVNGPPVMTIDPPDDDDSDDCDTTTDALVDRIRNNPIGFYVNVHTIDYPNGAIRGQLVSMHR
ncbi:MAG: CHRD domain-containing protein [Sphingosinicella sp.]